jgi:hypothetical protein
MSFATREGMLPAILVMLLPFVILAVLIKLLPPWKPPLALANRADAGTTS